MDGFMIPAQPSLELILSTMREIPKTLIWETEEGEGSCLKLDRMHFQNPKRKHTHTYTDPFFFVVVVVVVLLLRSINFRYQHLGIVFVGLKFLVVEIIGSTQTISLDWLQYPIWIHKSLPTSLLSLSPLFSFSFLMSKSYTGFRFSSFPLTFQNHTHKHTQQVSKQAI